MCGNATMVYMLTNYNHTRTVNVAVTPVTKVTWRSAVITACNSRAKQRTLHFTLLAPRLPLPGMKNKLRYIHTYVLKTYPCTSAIR